MHDISIGASAVLSSLGAVLRFDDVKISGDEIKFDGPRRKLSPIKVKDLELLAGELERAPVRGVARWTATQYEVLLAIEDSFVNPMRYRRDDLRLVDAERGIEYELGSPSRELSIGLLVQLQPATSRETAARIRRSLPIGGFVRDREQIDPFDYVSGIYRRFAALRIKSSDEKTPTQFRRYVNSFLFHVAYNLDMTLAVASSEGLLKPLLSPRGTRPDETELEAPRLVYDEEVASRYIAATASNDVVSQYLGYYHVLEGQFEPLYNDYVVNQVRRVITAPGFSMRRDGDISSLVKSVTKLVRERQSETAGIDERRALRLTLEKFVSIPSVIARLDSPEYVDALKVTEVSFSLGDKVDLAGPAEICLDALARRVYKTRNSVVHAKSSEESRYRPRRDAKELEQETRLMRALAEEVIVGKAEVLE